MFQGFLELALTESYVRNVLGGKHGKQHLSGPQLRKSRSSQQLQFPVDEKLRNDFSKKSTLLLGKRTSKVGRKLCFMHCSHFDALASNCTKKFTYSRKFEGNRRNVNAARQETVFGDDFRHFSRVKVNEIFVKIKEKFGRINRNN